MKNANKASANFRAAYHQHHRDIAAKIAELTTILDNHAMKVAEKGLVNAGDVSDLAKINSELTSLLSFLK